MHSLEANASPAGRLWQRSVVDVAIFRLLLKILAGAVIVYPQILT